MQETNGGAHAHRHDGLSEYCIIDHFKDRSVPGIPLKWWRMLPLLAYYVLDRKMHFTGMRGGLWRVLGVNRSAKNPNICNI